jgi:hypothetical protein
LAATVCRAASTLLRRVAQHMGRSSPFCAEAAFLLFKRADRTNIGPRDAR